MLPTWNKESQEWEDLAHAIDNQYVAHLGGPELFGQLLWAEAKQRGWERAADREVVGDGARWIWNLTGDHFYDAREAVDWYHALEHLSDTAGLLHGEGTPSAKKWYKSCPFAEIVLTFLNSRPIWCKQLVIIPRVPKCGFADQSTG